MKVQQTQTLWIWLNLPRLQRKSIIFDQLDVQMFCSVLFSPETDELASVESAVDQSNCNLDLLRRLLHWLCYSILLVYRELNYWCSLSVIVDRSNCIHNSLGFYSTLPCRRAPVKLKLCPWIDRGVVFWILTTTGYKVHVLGHCILWDTAVVTICQQLNNNKLCNICACLSQQSICDLYIGCRTLTELSAVSLITHFASTIANKFRGVTVVGLAVDVE